MDDKLELSEVNNEIIKMYNSGIGSPTIAKNFGITFQKVLKILKNNNVKLRTPRESAKKTVFNEDFFEEIDTEDKAYFLGFILADGSIDTNRNILKIGISDKDCNHLVELNRIMNSDVSICKYRIKNGYKIGGVCAAISFCSPKIIKDLNNLGISSSKTFTVKVPHVREDLKRHLWRGIMDGDGHVSLGKQIKLNHIHRLEFGICGNIYTMNSLSEYLLSMNITHKITADKSIFRIRICNRQALKVLDELYKDATIFLDRKYQNYIKYKTLRLEADSKINPNKGILKTKNGKYQAMSLISIHGIQKSIGTFQTLEEALCAQSNFKI
jgi:hypothetical protein